MQGEFDFQSRQNVLQENEQKGYVKGKAINKPILYMFICETKILESSGNMLRIGKVLGTRSALTVSKWFSYVYSILKNLNAFTDILLLSGKSIENLI